MGLTSPALPYLLALLAFVVLLAIVLCWPALGRRGWPQIGLRILSLIVLQALVLGLIFVVVNRSGEFYSSWSDLLGTDDGGASVVAASHLPVSTQRELTVTGTTPVRLPFGHAGGVLDSVRIRGELSGIVATGHVYLPAAYLARGPRKDYPVLTVISDAAGGGGSPYSAGRVAQTAATEIAANRMGPLIILMLPATIGRIDEGCLNLPPVLQPHKAGSPSIQAETFFAQDMPGAVEAAFRAASQASHWGLLGDQTGGYCALQLAMDNSGVFSAAVAPRAAYTQPPDAAASRIRGPFALQDDLIWQLTHLPLQPVSVLFAGPGSASGAGLAEPFIQLAQRPMRVSTAQLAAGTAPLARVLDWIATTLGSRPAGHPGPGEGSAQMGLTSGSFGTLMFIVAAAGIALVVVFWPLAARPKPLAMLARVGMVAVSQLLVITAFLVYLNSYFGFYASWSQLLGSGTTPLVKVVRATGETASLLTITGAEPAPVPGVPVPKTTTHIPVAEGHDLAGLIGRGGTTQAGLEQTGELLEVNINGQHSGIAVVKDFIYLPPQYFQPAYARARFPVLLALAGYPGSSWSIVSRLKLPAEQEALVRAGKAKPAVIVMMNPSVAMPRDTECTNVPGGPQVETFFSEDVPEAIEHTFRVQSGPGGWAALGYSTGGFCAVKLAMLNPRVFTLAVSLAGYYQALQDRTTGDLYGDSKGYQDENSPDWRLQHLPAPPVSVLVASSRIGELTYGGTLHFVTLVKPPMQVFTLYLAQGGHNFGTWGRELPQSLAWLSMRLSPAVPARGASTTGGPSGSRT